MVGSEVLLVLNSGGGLHVLSQWLELCQGFGALSMINQGGGGVFSPSKTLDCIDINICIPQLSKEQYDF